MKKLPKIIVILLLFSIQSCINKKDDKQETTKIDVVKQINSTSEKKQNLDIEKIYNSKYIDTDNALVNGHKIILLKKEYDAFYKKNDSTETQLWECGSPFEWLDEAWMIKTYGPINKENGTFENFNGEITTFYTNDATFDTNKHIVLFNQANAKTNSFTIISQNITLDSNTTLESFKKIFPNVEIEKTEIDNECRARFYLSNDSEAAFLFYFKNQKLNYFQLWWLLC